MTAVVHNVSPGLWRLAWLRLRADRVAMVSLAVVATFLLMLALSASGLIVADWEDEVGVNYAPPGFVGAMQAAPATPVQAAQALPDNPFDPLADDIRALRAQLAGEGAPDMYGVIDPLADDLAQLRGRARAGDAAAGPAGAGRLATLPFGGDKWGHDIIKKTIKGGETSIVVGLVAALLAVSLGTLFGALSGYFGGVVDDLFNWFYSIFTAIPSVLMILAVAAVLQQKGVLTIVLILGLTGWTGPYRLIRAEYIKHKAREYVLAADAIGASHWRKMFTHIFPNVSHVALVQMSILVVGFIKAEVILSFLGFGVPVGVVSWGSMLNEAQNELILGRWWQLTAAAIAMALLVTAFSLFTDALRDALDPKVK
ncbi:ABC transporter permease [Duganella sp. S19_KUP01_CR8]|uniref:ABC transporter permease n=1 Tax=Duganella sp. S19_KUP01_CR8 TaxID=3025502 RepID=UPI002FCD808A